MALTEPDLIERDADKITTKMIVKHEVDIGKTLYPTQAERLLIDLWAYREMLAKATVQETARQDLIAFACGPMIDYLSELVDVHRLATQPATTILQSLADEALAIDVLILAGTHVSASDNVTFATDTDTILKIGLLLVNATSAYIGPGTAGNGWQSTQVSQLLDKIDNVDLLVSSLTASSGSSEQEDDDRLRRRTRLVPESFINVGSRGVYRPHTMQAHPNTVDAAVLSSAPRAMGLYPLLNTGLPDGGALTLVESFCSNEKVRPPTDTVRAKTPVKVSHTIKVRIAIYRDQDIRPVKDTANSTIQNWATSRAAMLGYDTAPSQVISVLSASRVYQIELVTPALRVAAENEQVNCMVITLNMTRVSDS